MVSSGVFQSGFRPLFVLRLPQLWRKNRKEREKKEEKGERDRDKEEVLRRWAGRCFELVSDLFWGLLWGYLVLSSQDIQKKAQNRLYLKHIATTVLCATNPEPKTVGRRWNISNGGIAIWKGPIANLSFLHFMTTNVQRIHIFHNASFDGCSYVDIYIYIEICW